MTTTPISKKTKIYNAITALLIILLTAVLWYAYSEDFPAISLESPEETQTEQEQLQPLPVITVQTKF